MPYGYRAKKSRATKSKVRKTYKPKKTAVKSLKRVIKSTIQNYAEKKVELFSYVNQAVYSSIGSGVNQNPFVNITPIITQGDDQQARVGNQIRPSYYKISGIVRAFNIKPQIITMLILTLKRGTGQSASFPSGYYNNLINLGNSNSAWTDELINHYRPINYDLFDVVKKFTFKLGYANNVGSGTGAQPNNDFSLLKVINYSLKLPSVINYDDSSTSPNCKQYFINFVSNGADGSLSDNVLAYWTLDMRLTYTDV